MATRLRRILAATDFSHAADRALHRAARLAHEHCARLALVHVMDVPGSRAALWGRTDARLLRKLKEAAHRRLKAAAAALSREHGVRVAATVERGQPAQRIALRARRFGADLVVVGAHGAYSLLDPVLGTTAQRILRLAREPVLIARTAPRAPYREVLLPCDGSPSSRAAAGFARAAFPGARYVLANVANVPFEGFLTRGGSDRRSLERYRREFQRQAEARLRALAADAGLGENWTLRLRRGYVPGQILQLAQDLERGVIVMGAYGHHPLAATLLGSVSARVAAEAPCDVVLVKEGAMRTPRRKKSMRVRRRRF
jgi:nucleotide-binding universal stress UspA family protein